MGSLASGGESIMVELYQALIIHTKAGGSAESPESQTRQVSSVVWTEHCSPGWSGTLGPGCLCVGTGLQVLCMGDKGSLYLLFLLTLSCKDVKAPPCP